MRIQANLDRIHQRFVAAGVDPKQVESVAGQVDRAELDRLKEKLNTERVLTGEEHKTVEYELGRYEKELQDRLGVAPTQ